MPRAMTSQETRAFIAEGTRTANLATAGADGSLHVMPVWFVLEGDELVCNTGFRARLTGLFL
jgi:nitroimidazol reductase NimA-like FMN-containing flavoprotein (pyridoxamine 5'-phosphate oxidase superfamily)